MNPKSHNFFSAKSENLAPKGAIHNKLILSPKLIYSPSYVNLLTLMSIVASRTKVPKLGDGVKPIWAMPRF